MRVPRKSAFDTKFEAIYREGSAFVYRALRRCGVPERHVDDLAQEVFLVVLRRLHEYEPRQRLTGWLGAITYHIAARHLRNERHRPLAGEDQREAAMEQHPTHDTSVGGEPDKRAEAREIVLLLLAGLTLEQRTVFIMHHLDGLTVAEIAVALEIPQGTVATRLAKATAEMDAAYARLKARDRGRGILLLPLAALIEAEREIPPLPSDVDASLLARIQSSPAYHAAREAAAESDGRGSLSRRSAVSALIGAGGVLIGFVLGVLWASTKAPAAAAPALVPVIVTVPVGDSAAPSATAASTAAAVAPQATTLAPPRPSTVPAAPPRATPVAAPDTMAIERGLMRNAAEALGAGHAEEALSLVAEHARQFPAGKLAAERETLWIGALVAAGRDPEALDRAERYNGSFGRNPRVDELRRDLLARAARR